LGSKFNSYLQNRLVVVIDYQNFTRVDNIRVENLTMNNIGIEPWI